MQILFWVAVFPTPRDVEIFISVGFLEHLMEILFIFLFDVDNEGGRLEHAGLFCPADGAMD